jgi:hypothetical protein
MNPKVIANITNFIGFAKANAAASPLLDASIASDPIALPSPGQLRAFTRLWQKLETAH